MDLSCIISSGDLERYVLGQLPQEEAYQIEQLALLFPEVRAEIDEISAALEAVALAAAAAPRPSVKEELMGRLAQLKAAEEGGAAPALGVPVSPEELGPERSAAPVVPLRRRTRLPLAASLIGLVVCLGALLYLARLNRQRSEELAVLQQRVDTLGTSVATQQQQLQAYRQTMRLMHSPDYKMIRLTSVPNKPEALVEVFWNPGTSEVFAMDVSLPQAPQDKQYQLWAIVDGQPMDAGLLGGDKMQVQQMKAFARADAFAVTLEARGGSATPTMSELYVMAKAS